MEIKKVDLQVTNYGEVIFTANTNGNYSLVKSLFNKDTMVTTLDVVQYLNSGSPNGFSFDYDDIEKIKFVTPFGSKNIRIKFTKKGVIFFKEKHNRFYDSTDLPQATVDYSSTEIKVITVFKKLYKSFWSEEFIKNKVSDILNIDSEDIYLKREYWGESQYVINNDVVIEVDISTMKHKVVGLLCEDDAGRCWIEDVDSINGEIKRLIEKRDRLIELQTKLTS